MKDLKFLSGAKRLRALRLSDRPIQSLGGLESLPELHELRVILAHKLADVSALKRADIRGSHRCRASNAPAFGWKPATWTGACSPAIRSQLAAGGRQLKTLTRFPKAALPGFRVEFVARDVVDPKPHWAYQNNLRY